MSAANVKARSAGRSHKKPASETPWTKKLWIYDLRTDKYFTLKTNPLKRADLDEFVALFNPANRHQRQATWSAEQPEGRWRVYGWAWARLDAIAALKGGITVDKKRRDPTARPVPYLRVANVQRGYLDLEEVKEIEAPQTDIEELLLQPGDILFNEGGDRDKLGRGWIWEGQLAECIHQNHVFRARPYSADISGKLISWWGNTFGKDYFLREGKQTTNLASINMTKLSAFPVPIPPVAEQHRIVAEVDRRLSIVREVEAEVDANLKRAQAVLARAFGMGIGAAAA